MKNTIIHLKKSITLATAGMLFIGFLTPLHADTFDDQIAAARATAAQQQAQASALHAQANDYQSKVAELQAQISAVQSQIYLSQLRFDKITADLEQAKIDLAAKKAILAENVKIIYQEGGVTPLEMLASSGGFSQFIDKQQYMQNVKEKVQDSANAISALKAQLEKQKIEINAILADQQTKKNELASNKAEMNQLYALAASNASAADQQVRSSNAQIAKLKQQQAAAIQAASRSFNGSLPGASGGSGGACDNGHGNGGYPSSWCNAYQDAYQTPWGFSRECVSWAGWRRQQIGRPVYNWGNANTWDDGARGSGYRVDGNPEVGAVAQTNAGFYGHVAVVEAIPGNGTVVVSEMNYDGDGHFRYSTYSASYFNYIH